MAEEQKRPLKVFLCHASDDKPAVRELYDYLLREGVDAWLDEERILPGQDWSDEILTALQESDAIIICLSKISVSKEGYVQREIKEALEKAREKPSGTIFVIPSKLDDCEIPNYLRKWQWVDLSSKNGNERLMSSLRERANKVGKSIDPVDEEPLEPKLDRLYTEGSAAIWEEDWDKAYYRFQEILRFKPSYTRAAEKFEEAKKQRYWKTLYTRALDAQKIENWQMVIEVLEKLTGETANYKDADLLLKNAQKKKRLIELYEDARKFHNAQQWQAVIKVFSQILALDPNYPDTEGLRTYAQKKVAEEKRLSELNKLYSSAIKEMDAEHWPEAYKILKQVQKIQFGFSASERLLVKVEAEIKKTPKPPKKKVLVIASLVLAISVVTIAILLRGIPVRFSPLVSQQIYLYDTPENWSFTPATAMSVSPGRSFYLCRYDISSVKYLIADTFWDCEFGHTLGWSYLAFVPNNEWNIVIVPKQP